jgi:hypothetical protein
VRKSLLSACGLVFNVAVLAALYIPGTSGARALFFLPFVLAFLTFGSALLLLGGGRFEHLGWDRFWGAIVVLPRWVKAGLGLLFVVTAASTLFTMASTLASQADLQNEAGFERNFALVSVWGTAVGTALHYSIEQERKKQDGRR